MKNPNARSTAMAWPKTIDTDSLSTNQEDRPRACSTARPGHDTAGKQTDPDGQYSAHARSVARWFELTLDERHASPTDPPAPPIALPSPRPGQIMLITGPSGAGKTSALHHLRSNEKERPWRGVLDEPWGAGLVIDQFGDDVEGALRTLGRFGLGEAHTYLCPPGLLSAGQQWRLRLARAVHDAGQGSIVLAADEFASLLDRLTAVIVARGLRRAVDTTASLAVVVATGHSDLERALCPDVIVRCDFGQMTVEAGPPGDRPAGLD
jgi:ABC-type ATPase involved in cell division